MLDHFHLVMSVKSTEVKLERVSVWMTVWTRKINDTPTHNSRLMETILIIFIITVSASNNFLRYLHCFFASRCILLENILRGSIILTLIMSFAFQFY